MIAAAGRYSSANLAFITRFLPALVITAVALLVFPQPAGVVLQGLILGLLGALVAVGMALVYRANRILNFAQGELGTAPTVLAVSLVVWSGWNYFLALTVGVVGALVVGALVELVVVRRLFRAPRLILTVATLGVAQLLALAAVVIPEIWGEHPTTSQIHVPFTLHFTVQPIVFSADHLVALIVAPLALAGVAVLLRFTDLGVAIRASAERADRASLLGIPVKRLDTAVWAVAGLLSFVGVFLQAGILGLPVITDLNLSVLLASLAALVLGNLSDLPAVTASAVALGLLQQGVVWQYPRNPELVDPIFAAVIVVCLLARRVRWTRAEQESHSSWRSSDEVRSVPRQLGRLGPVMATRWLGLLAVGAVLVAVPYMLDVGDQVKAAAVVLFGIITVSMVVLTGWAGQVSLGQMSFAAFGAASGAYATQQWHLDLSLAMLFAGAVGAAVALVVGLPALRVRGLFLAVTTLAFAMATSSYLLNPAHFSWIPTETITRPQLFGLISVQSQSSYYEVSLVCLILTLIAVRGLRRSRTGRVLRAMRENERGAQAYGVNVTRAKLSAFAISGFLAAVSGCLLVHLLTGYGPDTYSPYESVVVFTAAVVGGVGSLLGGLLGALFLKGGEWFLPGAQWQALASAVGVLLVLMIVPGGLSDVVYRIRDACLRWVAQRRGIVVPSLVADRREDPGAVRSGAAAFSVSGAGQRADTPAGGADGAGPAEASSPPAAPAGRQGGRAMIPIEPLAVDPRPWNERLAGAVRHPGRWLSDLSGGGPAYALAILFGINMVDEMDRDSFALLTPNIRDAFHLSNTGILSLVAVAALVGLALTVPIAHMADRTNRVRLMLVGASVFAFFSVGTGLAVSVWVLCVARAGSGVGQATVFPTHNSLLADWFPIGARPRVYSLHRAANAVGALAGPLLAGALAALLSWRAPFLALALPTAILVLLGLRLREPLRGIQERRAMGLEGDPLHTEEPPPSFAESQRMVWKIDSLRRIFYALPFLAASVIGFGSLAALFYQRQFGLGELERSWIVAAVEPVGLVGLYLGSRIGTRLVARDPGLVIRFIAVTSLAAAGFTALFALSPWLWLAIVANMAIVATLAIIGPGVFAALSLAIPPRARSMGFSLGALWVIPGLIVLPLVGVISDGIGIRWGMVLITPVFVVGGFIIAAAGRVLDGDIKQVWTTAAARSEVLYERRHGRVKLLLCRGLQVSYGNVRVLFDVDLEIDEGEIVALLGANGAGKSTLLKAICGVVGAEKGAVIFDGRDITHAPPNEIAALGVTEMPGGQGIFPSLTVAENLRAAGWLERRRGAERRARVDAVLDRLPVLRERLQEPAVNLSGGQQQMLALGMVFLARPRLLLLDELSLGLAPIVIEQLLPILRAIREQGTTVVLVEQSVNLALTLADTAYFMERGEIRFYGLSTDLLERPDLLRSVFLEGAGAATAPPENELSAATDGPPRPRADGGAARPGPDGLRPALEIREVSVSFGGIQAVSRVTFDVAPGEIVGIIGPNGAGKTALFDLISGFTPAHTGQVVLGGRDLTGWGPDARARAGLGRSFQDARLFPALLVEETIAVALDRWVEVKDPFNEGLYLPVAYDSEQEVRRRVDELIALFNLEAFRSKFVHELSTGSRRIVDLACVAAQHPSVVLLDEPSSGIAQREAEALGPLLRRLRDELGASFVVVEHDVPLVASVADRLIALDQGLVIAEGACTDVLDDPLVVSSYLGDTEAAVARSGDRR